MFFDEIGPQRIEKLYFPELNLRAIVVVDRLVVEYKRPGVLKKPPDRAAQNAIEQVDVFGTSSIVSFNCGLFSI